MEVRELMTPDVVSITPEESVALAARLLTRHNLGALPVCGYDGRLRGMVTDRDILTRCVAADQDPSRVPVRDVMTREVEAVGPTEEVESASHRMAQRQVRRLPVVDQERVVGVISLCDLARSRRCDTEASKALTEISENVRRRTRQTK